MHFPRGAPVKVQNSAQLCPGEGFPALSLRCGCMNIALESTAYGEHLEKSGAQSPGFHLQQECSSD